MVSHWWKRTHPTDRIHEHCLATAGQAMQQHAMQGLYAGMQVYLEVCEGH